MWLVIFYAVILFITWKLVFPLTQVFLRHLLLARLLRPSNLDKLGKWVVITGATDGIGLGYARQLAARGCNLLLISRTLDKLNSVAEELRQNYCKKGQLIEVLQADLGDHSEVARVSAKLEQLEVGILVNNVGMTQPYPATIDTVPVDNSFFPKMICCNMLTVVQLTHAVLKGMLSRRQGVIINIGSASGLNPIPMYGIYSGSKRFVDFFTESLREELIGTGVQVHMVMPFYVRTKFIGAFKPPRLLAPTGDEYAEQAVDMIHAEPRTHGTLAHAVQGVLVSWVPSKIWVMFSHLISKKRQSDALAALKKK